MRCPECGTVVSGPEYQDRYNDQTFVEVYVCGDCDIQFEARYSDPIIEVTHR